MNDVVVRRDERGVVTAERAVVMLAGTSFGLAMVSLITPIGGPPLDGPVQRLFRELLLRLIDLIMEFIRWAVGLL